MIINMESLRNAQAASINQAATGEHEETRRLVHIPLHVLVMASAKAPAAQISPVIRGVFPRSKITLPKSVRGARQALKRSPFDLVVLGLDPLPGDFDKLLEALKNHETPMPTLLIFSPESEAEIYERVPDIPSTWELMTSDALSASTLERRMRMAIENHQRHWELSHLHTAFRSSLAQYRNLFDEVPDLIFLCDRSGCLLDINATAERMFGHTKDKFLLRPVFDTIGMNREDFQRLIERAVSTDGLIEDFEIELRPRGQSPIYGLIHMIRWQTGPGRPMHFQGVVKDISPHKLLETQLRQSEDQYKTLYELARISCSSLKLDEVVGRSIQLIHGCLNAAGTLLLSNRNYEELNLLAESGMPDDLRERFLDSPPIIGQDTIGALALSPGVVSVAQVSDAGMHPVIAEWASRIGPCHLVGIAMGRSNPTLPTSVLLMLIPGQHEDRYDELLAGLTKTLEMGMTNCLHYDNSLEAERRYRELWENAPTYFISVLKGGIVFEINQTALIALGYPLNELIGHPMRRIIDPNDYELFERAHEDLIETGKPQNYELRLLKKSGEGVIVSLTSQALLDRNGQRIGEKAALNDITRDKALKAQLRDYADNLERMVEDRTTALTQTMNFLNGILEGSTEHAIVGLDDTGTFLHFNSGAQLLFDYPAADMVGRHKLDMLIDFERASFGSLDELMNEVNAQGVWVQETPMITRTGHRLTALVTMNRLTEPAANNLTYVVIARDITEQKEMEDLLKLYTENLQQVIEQKTRELDHQHMQLIQSSKLATLGEMATGIAHELNQPLSGIRTRAQLICKKFEHGVYDQAQVLSTQREIIELIDRITHIINHMRIFARQDMTHFAPFNLNQSIQGALSLLGEQLRIHNIDVVTDIPDGLPPIHGEPLQIEQVILNLISNARDAMDARFEAETRSTNGRGDYHKHLEIKVDQVRPDELRLRICDNGTGMSTETLDKIFDPFFTTKPVGRGTGLGLSISYGILTSHSGRIEVQSNPGAGTTFSVHLPIFNESQHAAPNDAEEDLIL
ncbi:PAS domain S-box protein [bacterium]|nr:PAS domain S-box protein [bacterium]